MTEEAQPAGRRPRRRRESSPPLDQPAITVEDAFRIAAPRPVNDAPREPKQQYAQRLSNALAVWAANWLRNAGFSGVTPDAQGRRQEAPARTARGVKKLDVNYSTPELGLALGISIKTLNFRDAGSRRYTKNYVRIDGELRAEGADYHQRQPYAVLIAILFLPIDSCDDGGSGRSEERDVSSFGQAVRKFRYRGGRDDPRDDLDLMEGFFIGLYEPETGETSFFDVSKPPPRNRRPRPEEVLSSEELFQAISNIYAARNMPPFHWAQG
ncbi:MAG: hypothetical protein IT305_05605 [Chloroflexi bacterium]|nr:hypothetical protein [Chloroflexota bacterium]